MLLAGGHPLPIRGNPKRRLLRGHSVPTSCQLHSFRYDLRLKYREKGHTLFDLEFGGLHFFAGLFCFSASCLKEDAEKVVAHKRFKSGVLTRSCVCNLEILV